MDIEVEFRTALTEKEYKKALSFLKQKARRLGHDDRRSVFYVLPAGMLKVAEYVTQKKAKISYKVGRIGKTDAFEEIEIAIPITDVARFNHLFDRMGFDNQQLVIQKRENFSYKEVEIAMKWTESWGYHAELEIVISSEKERQEAEEKIRSVADELNFHLMNDQELQKFIADHKKFEKRN